MTRGKFITQVLDYIESTLTEVLTWTIFSGCSTELSQDVVVALFSSSHECCKAIGNIEWHQWSCKQSLSHLEGCLPHNLCLDIDLMITRLEVDLTEIFISLKLN